MMSYYKINNTRGFQVRHDWSPNRSRRLPLPHLRPRVALVHATASDSLEGTIEWFLNRESRVSADFVIGKDGEIVRMVPKGCCAWHAGICEWNGRPIRTYNHLSYGIELVNQDNGVDPYPEPQKAALAYVLATIQEECPSVCYIRRHADVAFPRGRKTDPNGLSLASIYTTVAHLQPYARFK